MTFILACRISRYSPCLKAGGSCLRKQQGFCALACIKGSPPSDGSETRECMGVDGTIRSKYEARTDISGAVDIAMDHSTATRAREGAPFRCMVDDIGAVGAGAGRIIFGNLVHSHTDQPAFIFGVLFELTVGPLRNFLVGV